MDSPAAQGSRRYFCGQRVDNDEPVAHPFPTGVGCPQAPQPLIIILIKNLNHYAWFRLIPELEKTRVVLSNDLYTTIAI